MKIKPYELIFSVPYIYIECRYAVLKYKTVPHGSVPVPYIYIKYRYAVLGLELTIISQSIVPSHICHHI